MSIIFTICVTLKKGNTFLHDDSRIAIKEEYIFKNYDELDAFFESG